MDRFSIMAIAPTVFPILLAVTFGMPRLLYRGSVRQIMRSNLAFAQPITVTVSAAGGQIVGAVGEATVNWAQFPYHAETEREFALFASHRLGGAVQMLPRRGLGLADSAPLRTLLAAHSRELG
jgi:hypothetical protein